MNKLDLVAEVALKAHLTKKDAEAAVDALFELIARSLEKGEPVKVSGFGSFEVRHRAARVGVVPGTTEKIKIPATKVVGFKPAKNLKEKVK
jgi:DNA-binding protein HU-beta